MSRLHVLSKKSLGKSKKYGGSFISYRVSTKGKSFFVIAHFAHRGTCGLGKKGWNPQALRRGTRPVRPGRVSDLHVKKND